MKTIKTVLKVFLLYFLAIHCLLFSAIQANADAMTGVPETGKPETHSSLTIDHSHASDGYIIVKAPKSSRFSTAAANTQFRCITRSVAQNIRKTAKFPSQLK